MYWYVAVPDAPDTVMLSRKRWPADPGKHSESRQTPGLSQVGCGSQKGPGGQVPTLQVPWRQFPWLHVPWLQVAMLHVPGLQVPNEQVPISQWLPGHWKSMEHGIPESAQTLLQWKSMLHEVPGGAPPPTQT